VHLCNSVSHILPPEMPSEIPPPFIIRVILIYGRSYCEPSVNISKVCWPCYTYVWCHGCWL